MFSFLLIPNWLVSVGANMIDIKQISDQNISNKKVQLNNLKLSAVFPFRIKADFEVIFQIWFAKILNRVNIYFCV